MRLDLILQELDGIIKMHVSSTSEDRNIANGDLEIIKQCINELAVELADAVEFMEGFEDAPQDWMGVQRLERKRELLKSLVGKDGLEKGERALDPKEMTNGIAVGFMEHPVINKRLVRNPNNIFKDEVAENLDLVNELEAFTNVTKMPQLKEHWFMSGKTGSGKND